MGKEVIKVIRNIFNSLLEVIYPYENKCLICGEENFIGICHCCKGKIKRSTEEGSIISYGVYGGILKELILMFKYKGNFTAGKILSDFLVELIKERDIKVDYICYVPMRKRDKKKRGYNQCEIMAKNIRDNINVDISHCIKKVKNTKEQKRLNKEERINNVEGAFKVITDEVKGKNILLIDDVVTTGSTIGECIKNLEKLGAGKINVLTIAKSNI